MEEIFKADRILLAALALSLLINIGQAILWRHERDDSAAFARSASESLNLPKLGSRIENLHLLTVTGDKVAFRLNDRKLSTVVYIMSPACGWCKLNEPNIQSLVSQLRGKYRFIGISTISKGLDTYLAKTPPPFQVYQMDPDFTQQGLELSVTPETLVFSPEGSFLQGWDGAYIHETSEKVSSYFGIKVGNSPLIAK